MLFERFMSTQKFLGQLYYFFILFLSDLKKALSTPVNKDTQEKLSCCNVRQLEADMVVMTWIARTSQPFSAVGEPAFKTMMNTWNNKYTIKHPSTFSKYKLPLLYNSTMDTIKKLIELEVPEVQTVAFTTDCWTSAAGDPYMALTLHYINAQFECRKFVLDFENLVGRHTKVHIAWVRYSFFRDIYFSLIIFREK